MRSRLPLACIALLACTVAFAEEPESKVFEPFASARVDIGIVVSDIEKAEDFYEDALGFEEVSEFSVPAEWATEVGLSNSLELNVHVMQAGEGPNATRVKLMEFPGHHGKKVDNSHIHTTLGPSYLTIFVADLTKSLKQAAEHGVKPLANGPKALKANPDLSLALVRDPDGNLLELIGPVK